MITVISPSAVIDESVKIWNFTTVCDRTVIGKDSVVGSGVFIGRDCVIGERVHIQHGVFIPNGSIIGNDVFIGPNATFTDDRYPRAGNSNYDAQPPVIKNGASIGAGAVVLPGVVIGEKAMVGAGAVVTKSVKSLSTVKGNPSK